MDEEDGGRHIDVKTPGRWKRFFRRTGLLLFTLVGLAAAFVAWTNVAAVVAGAGKVHDDVERLPSDGVMLVFGCDDEIDGGQGALRHCFR